MTKPEAKKRIEKLRGQIDDLRYRYHVLNEPGVSDTVYSQLTDELLSLEKEFPEFQSPDSPTERIGGTPLEKFQKVPHTFPILSMQDAFSFADLDEFEKRIQKLVPNESISYYCEPKLDGLAIILYYKNGLLAIGATRGDGKTGEDVTQNLKTIPTIPLKLRNLQETRNNKILPWRIPDELVIRGEVVMTKKVFDVVNEEQRAKNLPLYANPRNIAAGSIRQLDPRIAASRKLDFLAYEVLTDFGQTTHEEVHMFLRAVGFKTDPHTEFCMNMNAVKTYITAQEPKRNTLAFQCDGIVVMVNSISQQQRIGAVGKAPRWMMAFKFPAEQATTVVETIHIQVGRTGAMTPVAHLRPVRVAGTTVSRATLHNEDEIKRLGVRIGDTVVIQKAGDIIPEVVEVLLKMRTGTEKIFHFPKQCPVCGEPVERKAAEAAWYCMNTQCPARSREQLYHFASRKAFNIDGLGEKIIDQLFDEELIRDAGDIFTLIKKDLVALDRFAEKSADNLIQSIQNSKQIAPGRFLYALGIRHVGEETATLLAKQIFNDQFPISNRNFLEKFTALTQEDLQRIEDVGPVVAQSIFEYFHTKSNIRSIEKMFAHGVVLTPSKPSATGTALRGKTFAITGILPTLSRDAAKDLIRAHGGTITESVSKKTDYLVCGENPGSKYEKAQKLGITVITEDRLQKMVKTSGN